MILGTGPCSTREKKFKENLNCSKIDGTRLVDDEKRGKGHGNSFVRVYNGEKKILLANMGFFLGGWGLRRSHIYILQPRDMRARVYHNFWASAKKVTFNFP